MSTTNLINDGSIWRVGADKLVAIWTDKWIPDIAGYKVFPTKPEAHTVDFVADMIDTDSEDWNYTKVRQCFDVFEAACILKIPLCHAHRDDVLQEGAKYN
ncbi:hypothetical protein RIF29_15349 [Crotalaria pallida]|uniref:Uncharacterized protein n=1 Tax=Crotalaria pallida TaxID=3830 RepID=A0AAN9FFG8_CROPI